jgi:hypothetical protein
MILMMISGREDIWNKFVPSHKYVEQTIPEQDHICKSDVRRDGFLAVICIIRRRYRMFK